MKLYWSYGPISLGLTESQKDVKDWQHVLCYLFKRYSHSVFRNWSKWLQRHEALKVSGRGTDVDVVGWSLIRSHRAHAAFICILNKSGYSGNSTHFLLAFFFFNLAEWVSRDISEKRIWFLMETNHGNILICLSRSHLLWKSRFWELIKSKSLRGQRGQGHCDTRWLGFS